MQPFKIQSLSTFQAIFPLIFVLFLGSCFNSSALYQTPSLDAVQSANTSQFFPSALSGLTELKSFDVYVDQQYLHAIVAGTVIKGGALSVHYLRSDDGGRHWSKSIPISNNSPAPIASRGNDIQIAAAGDRLVALWQTRGEFPNQGPIASVYSNDAGKTWQAGANPAANNTGDQAHIDLATDQNGHVHAVWLEDPEEQGHQTLRYAKSITNGQTWEAAKTLDNSTCSCCWNTLWVSAAGELNVLYRDMQPRDMALLQSKDAGATWQTAGHVGDFQWTFDGCPHIGGGLTDIHSASFTILHSVVWTGVEQKQGLYYLRSENNGNNWSPPLRLGKNSLHGDIAALNARHLIAIWDEMGPEGSSVVSAHSEDGGQSWSTALPLSKPGNLASHPKVLTTPAGILAMWTEKPPKQPTQWAMILLE